jgi:hypothetical protein
VDVIDSGGLSDSKIFTVIVNEVNSAPTVAVIADQTIAEGTNLRFTIGATDPDLPANVLTYALLSPAERSEHQSQQRCVHVDAGRRTGAKHQHDHGARD